MSASDEYDKHTEYWLRNLSWDLERLGVQGAQVMEVNGVPYEVRVQPDTYAQLRRLDVPAAAEGQPFDFSALDLGADRAAQAAFLASMPHLHAALSGPGEVPVQTLRAAHAELHGRGVHARVMTGSAADLTEWATRSPLSETTAVSVFCLPPEGTHARRLGPAVLLASDTRAAHRRDLAALTTLAAPGDRVILIGMHVRLLGELRAVSGLYVSARLT
ncbi:hypothetical protein [Deinococcus radiotolerans]|uniref:Uncharacterized protein n=1 Tax=Deinococcus radiotolerans TaxID=1309407 RepID=A0ABQ2FNF8_9DEIO|nr:hypothetical protein [Deinococcus radiotolerans]GGL11238.1 hypothetical protein GCM10010844_32380 [Deinococcus radiotolerans]